MSTNNKHVLSGLVLLVSTMLSVPCAAQRTETILRDGWRFSRGEHLDTIAPFMPNYNDKKWQTVQVPHDWAIYGPFDKEIDKQVVAIEQNGEKEATEKTGRSGSLPWIGKGWYRTSFIVAKEYQRAILNFDAAMAEPVVYVNGKKAGEWKYGYTSFNVDVTDFVHKDGSPNTLAVSLANVEESSRWYPGAGLIRPVTLIQTCSTAIEQWSLVANTLDIGDNWASAEFKAEAVGMKPGKKYLMAFEVKTDNGTIAKHIEPVKENGLAETACKIQGVRHWTPETPCLYDLTVSLFENNNGSPGKQIDSQTKKIGFRTISYTSQNGFQLNGATRKFKGVCLHHDLGMIGAASNKSALIRQVHLLKQMGCDAIRTAHNSPSQMQMEVYDSLGMMVMAESFDMWQYPKCRNGYARFFRDWADRDIRNLVCSNRLHPSLVMWSVGNEIPEQSSAEGTKILRHLQDLVHIYDPTRPVTTGMDRGEAALKSGFAHVVDVPGMNYRTQLYSKMNDQLGHGFILGSETASTVSSRGVYKFPVVRVDGKAYDDGQCSSYDMEACWWSNIPEDDWLLQDDKPWVIGEFVWTGFDYLGEPTPYDEYWPSRSSYFGIFDLAGLPKDRYFLYRSHWNKQENTIHLLPHWTFPGREGETTPVYCYTNHPTAELFVNGTSQGRITKRYNQAATYDKGGRITDISNPCIDRYRLRWNNVAYQPGELKVVVYDSEGNKVGEETVHTAGSAHSIHLAGDLGAAVKPLKADGEDLTFITVSILDEEGNLIPDADNQIKVSVTDSAAFRGICNGDATSLEPFTIPTMKVFHGQLAFCIQNNGKTGPATVKVTSKGLKTASLTITSE